MSRRVALLPAPLAAPFGRMQTAPLPSQKTWMDMMERLEAKHGPQAKRTKTKKILKKKKKILNQNKILTSGRYPTLWSHGLIIPIFKKDDPSNPENYRGITLFSAMRKIFTSIMNNRLCDYLIEKGIITPEQCGFRKNMVHRIVFSF